MSSTYLFYVEAKVNNEWHCINAKYPKWKENWKEHGVESEITYKLRESYWNGSRSYFGCAYEKLAELGKEINFSALSPELKSRFSSYVLQEEEGKTLWVRPIAIDWNDLSGFIKDNEYDSHGLVHKDDLFRYEKGETEELWVLPHDKASKYSDKELEAYVYYEWDDKFGFSWGVKTVKDRVWETIRDFRDENIFAEDAEIRIIGMMF